MKTNSFCKVGLSNNSVIALSVSILIFVSLSTGCSKKSVEVLSQSFYNVPESNVRLVPDSVALLVAEKFNPEIFFSNKSTAVNGHSVSTNSSGDKPIKKLDGNNKIKIV